MDISRSIGVISGKIVVWCLFFNPYTAYHIYLGSKNGMLQLRHYSTDIIISHSMPRFPQSQDINTLAQPNLHTIN